MNPAGLDTGKLAAARLRAASRLPYLSSALFACDVRAAPTTGTIAVDRSWRVHADPDVVAALDVDQLSRLLVHLAAHLIRDHAERATTARADRHEWWNRCADAEINDDLRPDWVPAVAGDLPADLGCADGGLAETYYRSAPTGPRRWDCGSGADGAPRPWDADAPPVLSADQAQLLRLGVAADIQRRLRHEPGTIPAGWLRWAETVLPSRTDWRRLLAAQIRTAVAAATGTVDYTYRRPSRRQHTNPGVVMPTLYRPVPQVAIVCDTSGSMHQRLLARALAEIEAILTRAGLRNTQIQVLAVDTTVHAVRRVTRAAQVHLAGGGGTDMGAGITAATALRPAPQVIIVLTDGYTPWPDRPPPRARTIIGLLTEHGAIGHWPPPPWATTIHIDDDSNAPVWRRHI